MRFSVRACVRPSITLVDYVETARRYHQTSYVILFYATADEADAYMFYRCFFLFLLFPFAAKIPDNRSRERLNGFS